METIDYNKLWEQFKKFLKTEIGWYETYNYKPMNAEEFIQTYGEKMSDGFKSFMRENVLIVNRQCDTYAIYFIGEQIPN